MREIRYAAVNGKEIPVLISDENEALLAARAAGGPLLDYGAAMDGERRPPMRWKPLKM